MALQDVRAWLRSWWVTLRYGSPLTRQGRALIRNLQDDMSAYVPVDPFHKVSEIDFEEAPDVDA